MATPMALVCFKTSCTFVQAYRDYEKADEMSVNFYLFSLPFPPQKSYQVSGE